MTETPSPTIFDRTVTPSPGDVPTGYRAVTPSDTAYLPGGVKALLCVDGGNIAVQGVKDGAPVTIVGIPAMERIPGCFQRVWATHTTSTQILAAI